MKRTIRTRQFGNWRIFTPTQRCRFGMSKNAVSFGWLIVKKL